MKEQKGQESFKTWMKNDIGFELIEVNQFVSKKPFPCLIVINKDEFDKPVQPLIYGLIDFRDASVFYVGKTISLLKRLRSHCRVYPFTRHGDALNDRKYQIHKSGLPLYGCVLKRCQDNKNADMYEQLFIDAFKSTILNSQRNKWRMEPKYA
ncbi:MAG: GIY-YIG nuclease family protein [bacterium]